MAAPKVTKNNVEQTIDLKEEFGIDFSGSPQLRELLGQAIIEKIRDRTSEGRGMNFGKGGRGSPLKLKSPYSKEYADSLEFKAAGKSRTNINMSLSGDMMGLMDIKRQKSNSVTIGWNDNVENNKAFNHIVGDTVPSRPFFGVNKKELGEIKKEFSSELRQAMRLKEDEGRSAFEEFVVGLINEVRDEDG